MSAEQGLAVARTLLLDELRADALLGDTQGELSTRIGEWLSAALEEPTDEHGSYSAKADQMVRAFKRGGAD